jgi:hypothetical protein
MSTVPTPQNNELALRRAGSEHAHDSDGRPGFTAEHEPKAVEVAVNAFYPDNWTGFRNYGVTYNLVVAAAFLRNEIARRVSLGHDYSRAPRAAAEVYTGDLPLVSSAVARKG